MRIVKWLAAATVCLFVNGITQAYGQDAEVSVRLAGVWGETGTAPGRFRAPEAFAADPGGNLYICDTGNNRVQKFDAGHHLIKAIGAFGWEKEMFDSPVAVDARNGLDVFIADYNNQRIERYDRDLNYLSSLDSQEEWEPQFQFGFPRDMALSSQGELFCLDGENNRILKLDVMGEPQLSFGDYSAGEGRLIDPRRLAVSDRGLVFVTDDEADRITVFDVHGNYCYAIGEGLLESPAGLTPKAPDYLLVVDKVQAALHIFKETGEPVLRFPLKIQENSCEPVDVATWQNQVYILDRSAGRILILEWIGLKGFNQP